MTKAVEVTDSLTCTRVDLATSQRPFDLADKLWDFACEARPFKGQAFSTWQGRARLTYGKFTAKIKAGLRKAKDMTRRTFTRILFESVERLR